MPFVGEQAGDVDPVEVGESRGELERRSAWLHAQTVQSRVDLDHHRHGDARESGCPGDRDRHFEGVSRNGDLQRCRLEQFDQTSDLAVADEWVADEDVGDPCSCEHLCFAELGHLDADRTGLDLEGGDGGQLVCFGMRAKSDAVLGRSGCGPSDVALHPAQVDDDLGGVAHAVELERRQAR